jgi:hypothetical protein
MKKIDPTKYRILRTDSGDIYQRWWASMTITNSGKFEVHNVDVPAQWKDIPNATNKIKEIKLCKDIPIVIDSSYIIRLESLITKEKLRAKFAEKANAIINKKGFWNHLKCKLYSWEIRQLIDIEPEDYVKSFPQYPIEHCLA